MNTTEPQPAYGKIADSILLYIDHTPSLSLDSDVIHQHKPAIEKILRDGLTAYSAQHRAKLTAEDVRHALDAVHFLKVRTFALSELEAMAIRLNAAVSTPSTEQAGSPKDVLAPMGESVPEGTDVDRQGWEYFVGDTKFDVQLGDEMFSDGEWSDLGGAEGAPQMHGRRYRRPRQPAAAPVGNGETPEISEFWNKFLARFKDSECSPAARLHFDMFADQLQKQRDEAREQVKCLQGDIKIMAETHTEIRERTLETLRQCAKARDAAVERAEQAESQLSTLTQQRDEAALNVKKLDNLTNGLQSQIERLNKELEVYRKCDDVLDGIADATDDPAYVHLERFNKERRELQSKAATLQDSYATELTSYKNKLDLSNARLAEKDAEIVRLSAPKGGLTTETVRTILHKHIASFVPRTGNYEQDIADELNALSAPASPDEQFEAWYTKYPNIGLPNFIDDKTEFKKLWVEHNFPTPAVEQDEFKEYNDWLVSQGLSITCTYAEHERFQKQWKTSRKEGQSHE
jgi:hypothetical protein